MEREHLQELLNQNTQRYIDLLHTLCSFEATARDKQTLDEMVTYLEDFSRQEGFTVTRIPYEACGDFLLVEINPGAQKAALLMAHMDTVHPKGVFGTPAVRIEGDRMVGPGTIDCKGGIVTALLAMKVCLQLGYPHHIRLLLNSDEEVSNILGGQRELRFFAEAGAGFPCAINCELASGNNTVVSQKGILRQRIDIQGRSGHSGAAYFDCASAVREAAYKIIALEENSVPGGTTYNCAIVNGGVVANAIPDRCSITLDIRVRTPQALEEARRFTAQVAENSRVPGTRATVTTLSYRPPMPDNPQTHILHERLDQISRKLGFGPLPQIHTGFGSDSAYTMEAGIPSISGMGPWGEFAHSTDEYVYLPSVPLRAHLLVQYLLEYPQ